MEELLSRDQLCIRELQTFHELLDREKGFDADLLRNVAYLSGEIGEVVSAVRNFKTADEPTILEEARNHFGEELADCLAYILKLANYGGIDLQESYLKKMRKNLSRAWNEKQDTS